MNLNFETTLKESFNLDQFRIGQKEIISAIVNKKDVLAVLPTGGGKSLCYQLPAVHLQKLVIVISPLIALMKDQVYSLKRQGVPSGCLYSGQTEAEKREVFSQINKGGTFVLYLSPERAQKEGFQKWILTKDVALFAIDEAHCVSQWGHDFREEYGQLNILKTLKPEIPILALTASATPIVLTDIAKNLQLKKPEKMVHGFYRPNLYYQVEQCLSDEEKTEILLQALRQNKDGRILIYCGTRKVTESLSSYLQDMFEGVGYYHAGLPTVERTRIQEAYVNKELRILVATNAFGMGIDQPDVRLVVHYQMPGNIDSLYQEMGRAGRDEKHSTCLMLYSKKDKGLQSFFIQSSEAPSKIKDLRYRNLDTLVDYSEGSECRHAEILTYYKDSQRITTCGHCDSCDPKSDRKIQRPVFEMLIKTKTVKSKLRKSTNTNVTLDPNQEARFQTLKIWRKAKALELDIPAFVVFSDKSLRDMAIKDPRSMEELKNVHGIGDTKLEKFGWDILAELGHKSS
ncbi:MAG: ATP-dependent DNA helicase RecQ [Bdellovibrionota bacterium]